MKDFPTGEVLTDGSVVVGTEVCLLEEDKVVMATQGVQVLPEVERCYGGFG